MKIKPKNKLVLFLCVLLLCSTLFSTEIVANTFYGGKFYCSVQQYQKFNNNVLRNDENMLKTLFEHEKNRSFIVDSKTGHVNGISIFNSGRDIFVIDDGHQKDQAVKILWKTKSGYTHSSYLEIHQFVNTAEKPFILVSANDVISGICQ
jgi:hypothetical protein